MKGAKQRSKSLGMKMQKKNVFTHIFVKSGFTSNKYQNDFRPIPHNYIVKGISPAAVFISRKSLITQ